MEEHLATYHLRNSIWLLDGEGKSVLWDQVIEFSASSTSDGERGPFQPKLFYNLCGQNLLFVTDT